LINFQIFGYFPDIFQRLISKFNSIINWEWNLYHCYSFKYPKAMLKAQDTVCINECSVCTWECVVCWCRVYRSASQVTLTDFVSRQSTSYWERNAEISSYN
jgi:hypothetical protein